jgi:CheY-like chemotaxis protein
VFLNLLLNAAQAVEEGDIDHNEIRIDTWTDGKDVFAAVGDTGCGIPVDHLGRLFTPFFTTKPPGVGSGLGLFTCHNFIRSYGGRIEVESEAGAGSRFTVALPVLPGGYEPDAEPEPPDEAASERPVARGRILVVDDEPMIGSAMRRILRRDHDVSVATSGMQGKEILEKDPSFDLILCDLMMPDISGMDLHAWLEERNPKLAQKMVFVTGGAFTPVAKEFLQRVDNLRLEKPFDPKDLKAIIADLLCRVGDGGGSKDKE